MDLVILSSLVLQQKRNVLQTPLSLIQRWESPRPCAACPVFPVTEHGSKNAPCRGRYVTRRIPGRGPRACMNGQINVIPRRRSARRA